MGFRRANTRRFKLIAINPCLGNNLPGRATPIPTAPSDPLAVPEGGVSWSWASTRCRTCLESEHDDRRWRRPASGDGLVSLGFRNLMPHYHSPTVWSVRRNCTSNVSAGSSTT